MGNETPSYRTIGNFINDYIVPSRDKFFSLITKEIFRTCNLKMDKAFVDGSKFEADANKYKFVWKPTTFHNKLSDKIRIILEKYYLLRGILATGMIPAKTVADKLTELTNKLKSYDLALKENKEYKKDYDVYYEFLKKSLEIDNLRHRGANTPLRLRVI